MDRDCEAQHDTRARVQDRDREAEHDSRARVLNRDHEYEHDTRTRVQDRDREAQHDTRARVQDRDREAQHVIRARVQDRDRVAQHDTRARVQDRDREAQHNTRARVQDRDREAQHDTRARVQDRDREAQHDTRARVQDRDREAQHDTRARVQDRDREAQHDTRARVQDRDREAQHDTRARVQDRDREAQHDTRARVQDRDREAQHDTRARVYMIMSLVDSLAKLMANVRLSPFEKIEEARVIISGMITIDCNKDWKGNVPITTDCREDWKGSVPIMMYIIKLGQFCCILSNLINKALSMIILRRVRLGLLYTLERAHGNVKFIGNALEILLSSIFFDEYHISLLDEKQEIWEKFNIFIFRKKIYNAFISIGELEKELKKVIPCKEFIENARKMASLDAFLQRCPDDECAICKVNRLSEEMNFTILSGCRHLFCAACIKPWLKMQLSCPMCRKEVIFSFNSFYLRDKVLGTKISRPKHVIIIHRDTSQWL